MRNAQRVRANGKTAKSSGEATGDDGTAKASGETKGDRTLSLGFATRFCGFAVRARHPKKEPARRLVNCR